MAAELVVLSGKGGTGKTSMVGSLAALADNKILVDCDVDAADLHLILSSERNEEHDFTAGSKAVINQDKCSQCGVCVDYCRFDAIVTETADSEELFRVEPYSCEGCGVCRHFCPEEAIDFVPVSSGKWFVSSSKYGTLVHARLGIAESNSGKLVSILRSKAKSIAEEDGQEFIIVDGPPGIGCPVIASLTGADYALIVTEPSRSALHDMERVVDLAKHFDVGLGICINKFDINASLTKEVINWARGKHIEVLAVLPHDKQVVKSQIAGLPYVEYAQEGSVETLRSLWEKLELELRAAAKRHAQNKMTKVTDIKM